MLARMHADDAADVITELPQRRRRPVLDLLPPVQRAKVLTLMSYNSTSAGGLMAMDYVAVPSMATVGDALARVRAAVTLQPEALTSVHAVDEDDRLRGVARLVALLQADPDARPGTVRRPSARYRSVRARPRPAAEGPAAELGPAA